MKKCTRCKIEKSLDMFGKDIRRSDGRDSACSSCEKERKAASNKKDPEHSTKLKAAWRKANPEKRKNSDAAYGVRNRLIIAKKSREWRIENKDHCATVSAVYRAANKDALREKNARWVQENKEKHNAKGARYAKANPAKMNAKAAMRDAAKIQRTPAWLTPAQCAQIAEMYVNARLMSKFDGQQYHVDHIVPLRGRTVSGLHVPWNLQLLHSVENSRKNNHVWPDMP